MRRSFRGKSKETGEWIYSTGMIYDDELSERVMLLDETTGEFEEVTAYSFGQATGLYDKNGKEIYEGDIVRFSSSPECFVDNIVVFHYGAFGYFAYNTFIPYAGNSNFNFNPCGTDSHHEIVGNVADNPEDCKKILERQKNGY